MILTTRKIQYPEGDCREIDHTLRFNQLVDLNGFPLMLPLKTTRLIVYRVYKISTQILKSEEIITYSLELVGIRELEEYMRL